MRLAARPRDATPTPTSADPRPFLVAIVDDDPAVLRAMTRLLRTVGVATRTFTCGDELLALIDAAPSFAPACLVLDVRLAGASGLELQEKVIRSGRRWPVIFMTGYDEPAARARALGAGAVAFLRKPFRSDVLFEALRTATGRPLGG